MAGLRLTAPLQVGAVSTHVATIRGIDEAERVDRTLLHRALRNLVGRLIVDRIARQRGGESATRRTLVVAHERAIALGILVEIIGAVVHSGLQADQQFALADRGRTRQQGLPISILAERELGQALRQFVDVTQVGRARRREIPGVRVVRPLAVVHRTDQLGNDEVDVRVALAVAMRAHVDRKSVDLRIEIGTVIKVESPQEVLVRLALAAVLSDDQTGHELQQFTTAVDRTLFELIRRDIAFRGRLDGLIQRPFSDHLDRFEFHGRHAARMNCRQHSERTTAADRQPDTHPYHQYPRCSFWSGREAG